jgi:hypothetical protein
LIDCVFDVQKSSKAMIFFKKKKKNDRFKVQIQEEPFFAPCRKKKE